MKFYVSAYKNEECVCEKNIEALLSVDAIEMFEKEFGETVSDCLIIAEEID